MKLREKRSEGVGVEGERFYIVFRLGPEITILDPNRIP